MIKESQEFWGNPLTSPLSTLLPIPSPHKSEVPAGNLQRTKIEKKGSKKIRHIEKNNKRVLEALYGSYHGPLMVSKLARGAFA